MLRFKSLPLNFPHVIPPLVLLTFALFAFVFDSVLSDLLIYNRSLVNNGEIWRLFTGHFFHTNDNHFLLNAAALILLWALHGQYYNYHNYVLNYAIFAFICSVGMHWYSPDIELYVGLSGVLHGFFIWGAFKDIQAKETTGYLLLAGVVAKLIHEQIYGPSSDIEAIVNASVAIDAHLYGAIAGTLTFIFSLFYKNNKTNI